MSTLSATNKARQTVLGYPVDIVDEPLALEIVESAWRSGKRLQIVTLNAEMVVAAQQDRELDRIIRHAHLIIPDGAGPCQGSGGRQASRPGGRQARCAGQAGRPSAQDASRAQRGRLPRRLLF